jgi:hypothetical protein
MGLWKGMWWLEGHDVIARLFTIVLLELDTHVMRHA